MVFITDAKTYLKNFKINLFQCSKKQSRALSCVSKTHCAAVALRGGVGMHFSHTCRRNDIATKNYIFEKQLL